MGVTWLCSNTLQACVSTPCPSEVTDCLQLFNADGKQAAPFTALVGRLSIDSAAIALHQSKLYLQTFVHPPTNPPTHPTAKYVFAYFANM